MPINNFIFIDDNFDNEFNISSNSELNILCIPSYDEMKLNINLKVSNPVSSILNLAILTNKSIDANIESFLKFSESISKINVFAIAIDKSKIKININSIVPKNNINSKVDQKIKGILLSDHCNILGNPNLKIDSNEVVATHALSIGGINKEEEFFLLSKGFSSAQAKQLIINSYINNVLNCLNEDEQNKYMKIITKLIEKGQD